MRHIYQLRDKRLNLVEKLKQLQGSKTQAEFAAELGINQPTLSRILSGDRRIGVDVAHLLRQRHPEWAFELADYLLSERIKV